MSNDFKLRITNEEKYECPGKTCICKTWQDYNPESLKRCHTAFIDVRGRLCYFHQNSDYNWSALGCPPYIDHLAAWRHHVKDQQKCKVYKEGIISLKFLLEQLKLIHERLDYVGTGDMTKKWTYSCELCGNDQRHEIGVLGIWD